MSTPTPNAARGPYEIFLAVHNPDSPIATQLYDRLTSEGYRVFFYQKSNLPGDTWQDSIERALEQVHTFLVLLTDAAPAGWTAAEVRAAQRRQIADPEQFRIIPVLAMENGMAPKSLGVFLDDAHRCELHVSKQKVEPDDLARLMDTLRDRSPGPTNLRIVDEPYRGLEVYRTEDQLLFCGRDRETSEMVEELRTNRWLQVEGGSGSGKSSLVRAGLMPALTRRLRDANDADWVFLTMRPGGNPVKELAAALLDLDPENRSFGRLTDLEDKLWKSPDALANIVREWNTLNQRVRPRPILLLVDQFEELFTQAGDSSPARAPRREGAGPSESSAITASGLSRPKGSALCPQDQFVALLEAALSDKNGPLRLVTTIRSDFLHLVTQHEVLSQKLNYAKRYVLGPIAGSELRRCILDPLRMAGGRDAPDELVKRMIEDTEAGPGRLPLLSHTLRSLWHAARRRGDHTPTLRFEDYEAIGGVGGAVTRSADELLHSLTLVQQQAARRMLLELVHPGRGVRDVRKTATREALLAAGGAEAEGVLLQLSGGAKAGPSAPALPRLLVADQSAALAGHLEMVDLIHDSLVDRWGTLRGWLDEARRDLERRIDLEAAATAWANAGSLRSDLPSPGLAAYYTKWDGDPPTVSTTAQQYLDAARRRHRGQRKLVIGAFAGTGAAAVLFAALAVWAMGQRRYVLDAAKQDLARSAEVARMGRREAIARALATEQQNQARRDSARGAMERGVRLCEFGDRRGGMLWLARGLETAHALGDVGLEHSIRLLLAGWNPFHERVAVFEHDATVFAVAYSPNGKTILTGCWENTAQLWDVDSRRRIGAPMRHESQVDSVAYSRNGKLALTRSVGEVRVWSAADGKAVSGPFTHSEKISAAAFSPDGKTVLTGSHDATAKLWSVATGEEVLSLPHDRLVEVVAFSPDGKTLVTGEWDVGDAAVSVRLWNAPSGDLVGKPMAHRGAVEALAFSPDSKVVVTASGPIAQIWNAETGDPIGNPLSHDADIHSVAFSPDGKVLATGSDDNTAKLWDAHAGSLLVDPLQHEYGVWSLAFSPDGETLLTGTAAPITLQGGELGLWDVARGASHGMPIQFAERINSVAFSPDGKYVLAGSHDRTASIWRVGEGRALGTPKLHPAPVSDVSFNADGRTILTACYDGTVRVWDVKTDKQVGKTIKHPRDYFLAAFSADGKNAFTGGGDENVGFGILWDALTGQQIGKTLNLDDRVSCSAFSPDGNWILTGSGRFARLWDASTGEPLSEPLEHQGPVQAVAFSRDGKRFVVGGGGVILSTIGELKKGGQAKIWDAVALTPLGKAFQEELTIRAVAFSPDGKTILTGSEDKTAQLWDVESGARIGRPLRHQHAVTFVAISPDNQSAATVSEDGIAQIWDARTGKPLAEPLKRVSAVRSVAFSPDSKLLLTASFDGASLWDVSSGRLLSTPNRSSSAVIGVSFSPDGKSFATAGGYRFQGDDGKLQQGGEVQIWRVPTPMESDVKQIMRWTNVYAGLELTSDELTVELDQPSRINLWRELTKKP